MVFLLLELDFDQVDFELDLEEFERLLEDLEAPLVLDRPLPFELSVSFEVALDLDEDSSSSKSEDLRLGAEGRRDDMVGWDGCCVVVSCVDVCRFVRLERKV